MNTDNPDYYWDKMDECFRHCDTNARIEGNPPRVRAQIKNSYPLKSYRGKVGTIDRGVQFNKVYFQTDQAMAKVLIDRDYLEVLP